MVVLALILINKAGGLVYNRTFAEGLNQLSTNDYLVLAGTFHGVHAITARLNPVKNRSSIQSQQFPSGGGVGPSVPPSQGLSAQPLPGQQQQHHQPGGPNQSAPLSNPSAGAGAGAGAGGGGALADGNLLTRPEPSSGIEVMETENFRLQCFATQTGLKFLLFTDAVQASGPVADAAMRRIYEYYADYVMKNPFYQLEMPVRCEMFDRRLNSYIREINSSAR